MILGATNKQYSLEMCYTIAFILPPHQPNLKVRDVIHRIKDLNLNILNDAGFFNVHQLREAFIKILQEGCRHAGVLIIPPANSVAVLFEHGQMAVFDSHQHGNKGGQVLWCNLKEIDMMLNCLGKLESLCWSNFAELGLTK